MQLWSRPWALLAPHRRYEAVAGARLVPPSGHAEPCWLYTKGAPVRIDGKKDAFEPLAGFNQPNEPRQLVLLPLPARHKPLPEVQDSGTRLRLDVSGLPERFRGEDPKTADEALALALFRRAEDVWDRLAEVETALADPATLWSQLAGRWGADDENHEPRMDIIVRQARKLKPVLEALERGPRKILRRTHRMIPISRLQEMDRRAMTWLIRQPGDTMEERAGDDQRLLGVAREENYDTLENRVLRAYLDLARHHAKDYLERHRAKANRPRYRLVKEFRAQALRLDRRLQEASVRRAEPGVTANYVLLENPRYRQIWVAWEELLRKKDAEDELWRWQVRSWEEFTALLVVVALQTIPEAQLVAASPLTWREEQSRGSWLDSINPLCVFHLPRLGKVVEVQYRAEKLGSWRADLGAPIWLRMGATDDWSGFPQYIPIWPLWSAGHSIHAEDIADLSAIAAHYRGRALKSCILVQPCAADQEALCENRPDVSALAIGCSGVSLSAGLSLLRESLVRLLGGVSV